MLTPGEDGDGADRYMGGQKYDDGCIDSDWEFTGEFMRHHDSRNTRESISHAVHQNVRRRNSFTAHCGGVGHL